MPGSSYADCLKRTGAGPGASLATMGGSDLGARSSNHLTVGSNGGTATFCDSGGRLKRGSEAKLYAVTTCAFHSDFGKDDGSGNAWHAPQKSFTSLSVT